MAAAKNAVSQQQHIASAKEAHAAAALQHSAHAAAAEIERTGFFFNNFFLNILFVSITKFLYIFFLFKFCLEQEAARIANLQRANSATAAHHLTATKDSALAPLLAGNNHVPGLQHFTLPLLPWNNLHLPKWPLTAPAANIFLPKPPINLWG